MKTWAIWLLVLALAACKPEEELNQPIVLPNRLPDVVTESGIFIWIEEIKAPGHALRSDQNPANRQLLSERVEATWQHVQSCLNMYSDEPPNAIIVEDVNEWLDKRGIETDEDLFGFASYEENIILIESGSFNIYSQWAHELIHIDLYQNGVPDFVNSNHQPNYVWSCEEFEPAKPSF